MDRIPIRMVHLLGLSCTSQGVGSELQRCFIPYLVATCYVVLTLVFTFTEPWNDPPCYQWGNPRSKAPFSSSQTLSHYQRVVLTGFFCLVQVPKGERWELIVIHYGTHLGTLDSPMQPFGTSMKTWDLGCQLRVQPATTSWQGPGPEYIE